jgi:ornithine decarboxylase
MIQKARFVLSKSVLLKQYKKLEDLGLKISYSIKTNNVAAKVLEESKDCMFSVHTMNELGIITDKSRIWFLAESWNESVINALIEKGVRNFIVYNSNDLDKLTNYLENKEQKINLLLRVKLKEHSIFTERCFVFGMDAKTLNESIHKLRNNKNIGRLGVHFHRKTQNVSEWSLKYELNNILDEQTLKDIDFVNIGGGIPIKYRNTGDDSLPFIFSKIKELQDWLGSHNIEVIVEPGRFLSGPATKLEAYVQNICEGNITVNCSVYNSSMDTLIVPIKLMVEGELPDMHGNETNGQKYTIKGSTPCSLDIFRYSARLPKKAVGDKITFLNAGAYNFHTDFCGLDKLETEIAE